ncbi:hypothetical protein ACLGC4_04700 [Helicobacter pylori]
MAVRFGVIFISGSTIDCKAKQLRSILERKKEYNFIWFNELSAIIGIIFIVKYLLGLKAKLGFEPTGIFYCENANTHKIELISNDSDFKGVLLEFSENIPKAPNEIPQFLTNFKNSKIPNKKILFSATKKKYSSTSLNELCEYFKKRVRDTFDRLIAIFGMVILKFHRRKG